MKKLFAILLTLLMVLSLPLFVMAEDAADTTETIAEITTEASAEETTEASAEVESENGNKMNFGFYPETLVTTLPIMGMGMLGIFLVTCVIVLAVVVLSKFGKEKEE